MPLNQICSGQYFILIPLLSEAESPQPVNHIMHNAMQSKRLNNFFIKAFSCYLVCDDPSDGVYHKNNLIAMATNIMDAPIVPNTARAFMLVCIVSPFFHLMRTGIKFHKSTIESNNGIIY